MWLAKIRFPEDLTNGRSSLAHEPDLVEIGTRHSSLLELRIPCAEGAREPRLEVDWGKDATSATTLPLINFRTINRNLHRYLVFDLCRTSRRGKRDSKTRIST